MNLLLVPSLVTNVWQAAVGGQGSLLLRRLWPFFLLATVMIWIGAAALTRVDLTWLSALLGLLLVLYAGMNLAGARLAIGPKQERWSGSLFGAVNGLLTGMTGSFVVPGVLYLQAIGLPRDSLIQAMGILFTLSTLALAAALGGNGLLSADLGLLSVAALLPALAGMAAGQSIRRRLPEALFRKLFFGALLLLGFYVMLNALVF